MQKTVGGSKQTHHHNSGLACWLVYGNDCCGIGVGRSTFHTSVKPRPSRYVLLSFVNTCDIYAQ